MIAQVAEWLREPNPVMIKELRAILRRPRFFAFHILTLCAAAMIVILHFAEAESSFVRAMPDYDATETGRKLYYAMQLTLMTAIIVAVPGFCATSVSQEKDRKTIELLVSCSANPYTIVTGKFLNALVLTGVLILSAVPLLAMSFLFGGITVGHVIRFCCFLFFMTAFLSACVIYISCLMNSSLWSVITSYIASAVLGMFFVGCFHMVRMIPAVSDLYGIIARATQEQLTELRVSIVYAAVILPLAYCVWLTALLFTAAANSIDALPVYRLGNVGARYRAVAGTGFAIVINMTFLAIVLPCLGL